MPNLNLPNTRHTWVSILSVIRKCPCNGLSIEGSVIPGYHRVQQRDNSRIEVHWTVKRRGLENHNSLHGKMLAFWKKKIKKLDDF